MTLLIKNAPIVPPIDNDSENLDKTEASKVESSIVESSTVEKPEQSAGKAVEGDSIAEETE